MLIEELEHFVVDDEDVVHWCPRCRTITERSSEPMFCMNCGTAMLDRFCIVCREPLFGPDLVHFSTMAKGGPRVI